MPVLLGHLHSQQARIRRVQQRAHLGIERVAGSGIVAKVVWRHGLPESLQLRLSYAVLAQDSGQQRDADLDGMPALTTARVAHGEPGVPTVAIDNVAIETLHAIGFPVPTRERGLLSGRTVLLPPVPDAEPVPVRLGDHFSIDGSRRPESMRILFEPVAPFGLADWRPFAHYRAAAALAACPVRR